MRTLRTEEAYLLLGADGLAQLSDRGSQILFEKEEDGVAARPPPKGLQRLIEYNGEFGVA